MRNFCILILAVVFSVPGLEPGLGQEAEPAAFSLKHKDFRTTTRLLFHPKDELPAALKNEERVQACLAAQQRSLGLENQLHNLLPARVQRSLTGVHYWYRQMLNGLPVEAADLIVSLDPQSGLVRRVFNNTYPVAVPPALALNTLSGDQAVERAWRHLRVHGSLQQLPEAELMYAAEPDGFRLIYKTRLDVAAPRGSWEHRIDALTGEVLSFKPRAIGHKHGQGKPYPDVSAFKGTVWRLEKELRRLQAAIAEEALRDALPKPVSATVTGTGMVFNPNPVITLMNESLEDGTGAATFLPAYVNKTLRDITETAGVYSLEGPWVTVQALSGPDTGPNTPSSTTNDGMWTANRGDNAFNDAMAYYHVDTNQRYIQTLGFSGPTGILFEQVEVDTDAVDGADQSYFYSPNRLLFGRGCVDDAEDSDVILHEYGHGIQYNINNSWSGGDTGGMGEGFGDYWAGSYKYQLPNGSTFRPEWIFSWDGHNGCWAGRRLDRLTFRYNPDFSYGAHQTVGGVLSDELWSTPLFQAMLELIGLGRPIPEMDQIVLESHFGLGSGLTMPELAMSTVDAARTLYPEGPHAEIYTKHFLLHHILALPTPDLLPPSINGTYAAGSNLELTWSTNDLPVGTLLEMEYSTDCTLTAAPVYSDDMESGTNGWTVSHGAGTFDWAQTTSQANSPVTSWFAADVDSESDQYLVSPMLNLPANALLVFWHRFEFESGYDGGVVEISTAGPGGPWSDLGSLMTMNGYNGGISTCCSNPLSGQPGFTGTQSAFMETHVDLSSYSGNVHLRFRLGTDLSVSDVGWWVDDVQLYSSAVTWVPLGPVSAFSSPFTWGLPSFLGSNYCLRAWFSHADYRDSEVLEIDPFSLVADTDGDGIPDFWESDHGLNPLVPDALVDGDGDGMLNIEEYIADTHPGRSGDYLRVQAIQYGAPAMISYSGSVDRVYHLDYSPGLLVPDWQRLYQRVPGSNALQSLPDPAAVNDIRRHYRLEAQLP